MRDGHGDIVPEGFYDQPEHDDLKLIQSEYDKLYILAQEMAGALESCLKELWDDMHSGMSEEQFDAYFEDEKQALTKWTEFNK